MKSLIPMVCLAFLWVIAAPIHAGIINTSDRGWYDSINGFHNPGITNYGTGFLNGVEFRNFLAFDLSTLSSNELITSASLRLFNPANSSPGTYDVYDVTTDIGTLLAGGNAFFSTFNDLGTGVSYGSVSVPAGFSNQFVTVSFNAAGVQALNAAKGNLFATGGTFTGPGFVFGSSGGREPNDGWTQLVLETSTVPEPSALAIFGIVALGCCIGARRNNKLSA